MSNPSQRALVLDGGDVRVTLEHAEGIDFHRHPEGQLLYAVAGVLATTTDRGIYVAPGNRITWTPPGIDHSHRAHGETEVRLVGVPIRLQDALGDRPALFPTTPLVRAAILTLTSDREFRTAAKNRLRHVVVDELADAREDSLYLPEPLDDRLRAVTGRLHENPSDSTTPAELSRAAGVTERSMERLFDSEVGLSFEEWRTRLRVQHALIQLTRGQSPAYTSIRLGWTTPADFTEDFTRLVGESPDTYQAGLPTHA